MGMIKRWLTMRQVRFWVRSLEGQALVYRGLGHFCVSEYGPEYAMAIYAVKCTRSLRQVIDTNFSVKAEPR
jgi:hypothetical protein